MVRPLIERMRDIRTPEGRRHLWRLMKEASCAWLLVPVLAIGTRRGWGH